MKITCIIPAYNEASTISYVLENVKKVSSINEIIVVDDGSTDATYSCAVAQGIKVIKHPCNKGKGAAIKTGVAHAHGEVLLFLDADLTSITPKKITSIIQPIKNDEADFVKTSFTRARGRVTELVVKPLFKVIFPFITFHQPLSGQFAIRANLMEQLHIDDAWGVDIQILLQLVKKRIRIAEVDIGYLIHKKQPLENLAIMSEQVIRSILEEVGIIANKHKLVIFDFDKTLIQESSIEILAQEFGLEKELKALRAKHFLKQIADHEITALLARLLKGRTMLDFQKVYRKLHLTKHTAKVIDHLRKRRYNLGIISHAFSPIVEHFAKILDIPLSNIICPKLIKNKHNIYTGEFMAKTIHNAECCDHVICKGDSAKELMRHLNVSPEECIAVGDGKSDQCLFRVCGLSLLYNSSFPIGDIKITNMSEVLIYAE